MLAQGELRVSGQELLVSSLFYIEPGNNGVQVEVKAPSVLMLIGGVPFPEKILMWWNFIGRTQQDVAEAREDWNSRSDRFGYFEDKIGGWIPAPELPNVTLQAR